MRFVATKSEEQQSGLMLHRSRQFLVCQRTMLSNAIRGMRDGSTCIFLDNDFLFWKAIYGIVFWDRDQSV
jgi:hypothetical protein